MVSICPLAKLTAKAVSNAQSSSTAKTDQLEKPNGAYIERPSKCNACDDRGIKLTFCTKTIRNHVEHSEKTAGRRSDRYLDKNGNEYRQRSTGEPTGSI